MFRYFQHNQSDIQYSINDEIDDSLLDTKVNGNASVSSKKPKKPKLTGPIFRPKATKENKGKSYNGIQNHANGTKGNPNRAGSENSLLDEDDFLRRGMDEDGSFREGRYAQ